MGASIVKMGSTLSMFNPFNTILYNGISCVVAPSTMLLALLIVGSVGVDAEGVP
jgi:hypothetical protein